MANEKRLIDGNAFFDRLKKLAELLRQGEIGEIDLNLLIASTPTVDAVEVVHSKWDTVFYERNGELATYSHICPICKYHYKNVWEKGYNYCPNCGAKMDGDGNG